MSKGVAELILRKKGRKFIEFLSTFLEFQAKKIKVISWLFIGKLVYMLYIMNVTCKILIPSYRRINACIPPP